MEAPTAESLFFSGTNCLDQGNLGEAESAFRRAVAVNPGLAGAWCNLGIVLALQKREAEAETCYRIALDLFPEYRNAAYNLAYLLLRQGRYEEGWLHLEARDWYERMADLIPDCPRWQGEPLDGKSILIGVEVGHGDMIQLCRYAPLLKARGAARVSICCHPGLVRLFRGQPGIDSVFAANQPLPSERRDFWVPPFSLPFLFQTRVDSIPAALPYLSVPPDLLARWQGMVGGAPDLRVGLVWRGHALFANDADRSLASVTQLAPLAAVPGIRYYSLMKEPADIAQAPFAIENPMGQVEDFADTAAIISHLDLVIAVDTAVAHLAGALAKPCWVLLPYHQTDWRWLADRGDSPWYPGIMRLFRQLARGDWGPVVASLADALRLHSAAWHSNRPSSRRA